jgi:hypothetical protein
MKNTLPDSLLAKLYDATGTTTGGNKGFFLAVINDQGDPVIISKSENSCVTFALKYAIETFMGGEGESINQ